MTLIKLILKTILYKPLYNALIFLVWLVPGHSVGWAIIILTIIIRLLLLPSSANAIKSQKKFQEMQPEIDKIKEKYKNDSQAQSKAMMSFYQTHKVNPLSSCLPLLIQFPILIILYYVFQSGLDTSRFDLLYSFTPHPQTINTLFLGINLAHPNLILAVIAGILQFVQTKQITSQTKKTTASESSNKGEFANQMQNIMGTQMVYIMPIFTIIIAMKLPAALPIYWIITTIFAIYQQSYILKTKENLVSVRIRDKNE